MMSSWKRFIAEVDAHAHSLLKNKKFSRYSSICVCAKNLIPVHTGFVRSGNERTLVSFESKFHGMFRSMSPTSYFREVDPYIPSLNYNSPPLVATFSSTVIRSVCWHRFPCREERKFTWDWHAWNLALVTAPSLFIGIYLNGVEKRMLEEAKIREEIEELTGISSRGFLVPPKNVRQEVQGMLSKGSQIEKRKELVRH